MFRTLRDRYDSDPQIDIEKQIARVRVPKPLTFEWSGLEDGLRRNNVGLGDITLSANIRIENNQAVLSTGQTFPLEAADAPEKRRKILFSEGTTSLLP